MFKLNGEGREEEALSNGAGDLNLLSNQECGVMEPTKPSGVDEGIYYVCDKGIPQRTISSCMRSVYMGVKDGVHGGKRRCARG